MTDIAAPLPPAIHGDRVSLLRVLGPVHVWALGVGIVLVGYFVFLFRASDREYREVIAEKFDGKKN